MEQIIQQVADDVKELDTKRVTVCIRSSLFTLHGPFHWEMASEAVYCSDVMWFPPAFEGTKGIIHPEDLRNVIHYFDTMVNNEIVQLKFRIITTYGEVKSIYGYRVILEKNEMPEPENEIQPWAELTEYVLTKKETEHLELIKELTDAAEKIHNTGTWFINKSSGSAFYSNNVYHIHGLLAQGLNAHANTFHSYIHSDDRDVVIDTIERAYSNELPLHLEYRIVKQDNEIRHLELVTYWLYNKQGQANFCGVVQDITAEKAEQEQLLMSRDRLKLEQQTLSLLENQTDSGHFYINLVTRKISFSENFLRLHRIKAPVIPGTNTFLAMVLPADQVMMEERIADIFRQHTLPETEYRIVRTDGKVRHMFMYGKIMIDTANEMVLVGTVHDITSRKALEKKLQDQLEHNELLKLGLGLMEDVVNTSFVIWHSLDGPMIWSEGFYKLLGYKPGLAEPMQRIINKSISPADLKAFKDAVVLALNGQLQQEITLSLVTKTGIKPVKFNFRSVSTNNKTAVAGIVQDLSEQQELQPMLQKEQRFNELLANSSNDTIILSNPEHSILFWNKQAEEKTGIKKNDALYKNLFDVLPALKTDIFISQLNETLFGQRNRHSYEREGYLKVPHSYVLTPLTDENGRVIGILHVVHDASREMELKNRLNDRLNFIEKLVEATVDRVVVLDRNMNYLYWNHKAEEYYALKKQKVIGKNILEIFPGFRNDPSFQEFRKVLKGETVHIPADFTSDDRSFDTYLSPVKDASGAVSGILWVVHDLSKEKELQLQQQKSAQLLDSIQGVFVELDFDLVLTFVNNNSQHFFGKQSNELVGKKLTDVYSEMIGTEGYKAVEKAFAETTKVEVEFFSPVLKKWIFLSVAPSVTGVIIFIYDRQEVVGSQRIN